MAVTVFEFGEFTLDCDRFELCRAGRSLKLERKPMELLILLAGSNGHLVTRTEIAERLWDHEVFVDTEHGINTAIRKIRQVLRDDPEQPRFVQTVTGKGYRFIGPMVEAGHSLNQPDPRLSSEGSSNLATGNATRAPTPLGASPDQDVPANGLQVGDLAVSHADLTSELKGQSASKPRFRIWLVALGALAALAFLVIAIRLGARGWADRSLNPTAKPAIRSLAVLPLDNLSGEPGQDYFADGMTDELITMLAKNSTLRIVSRTSVMQYKGAHRPLPEIARALGVDGILEGSVTRSGDKVHMTIQLIQAPSDTHVWAESYDRDEKEAVSLPGEAAQTIAKKLNSAALQPTLQRYVSPEAHDAYLHGRYLWFMDKNDEAGKYFKEATELQPDYALAWTGLSGFYGAGMVEGQLNPAESLAPMEAASRKAAALDPSLADAHLALSATFLVNEWDWARADQEILRAIELDPKFAEGYHFRAKILGILNRHQEAIEMQKKATELDPFSRPFALALAFVEAREYDAAIADARQRLESNPQDLGLQWMLWDAYRRKGAEKEAELELEKALRQMGNPAVMGIHRAFEQGGSKAVLRWRVNEFKQKSATHYVSPVDLATLTAQLGRREETLALLEEGYRQHSPLLLWIQDDPAFDFLHADERYRSIIRRVGLPPAY